MAESQAEVIAFLADPRTHGGQQVQHLSTHGAHIFLAGAHAYKIKRAVSYSFMDFSTLEKRHAALESEYALNHARAPQIYRGLRPIRRSTRGLSFEGEGRILEWVLVMARFDQEAILDDMAQRQTLTAPQMRMLASEISAMHRSAPQVTRAEGQYFCRLVDDLATGLQNAGGELLKTDDLATKLQQAATVLRAHLDQRAQSGFVRHAHGDLHLRNIIMIDGRPVPIDALEFDEQLASGDVYYDLAFLLMDLDHRELRPLAWQVLNRYVEIDDDIAGLKALPLFLATRAAIRARVSILAGAAGPTQRDVRRAEAQSYVGLALSYLPPKSPRFVAIGGLSGTGKSAAAIALAPTIAPAPGALVLRSDVVRKRLCGVDETVRLPADSYTAEVSQRVYAALEQSADRALEAGWSVIVDAVFARPEERDAITAIGRNRGTPLKGIWLEADIAVRRIRISARRNDASDATEAVVDSQETYKIGALEWRRVSASGTIEDTTRAITQTATAPKIVT